MLHSFVAGLHLGKSQGSALGCTKCLTFAAQRTLNLTANLTMQAHRRALPHSTLVCFRQLPGDLLHSIQTRNTALQLDPPKKGAQVPSK